MPQTSAKIQNDKCDTAAGLTVADAAGLLSVSQSHLWKMLRDGEIRAVKFGRRTIIPLAEVVRVLSGGAPCLPFSSQAPS